MNCGSEIPGALSVAQEGTFGLNSHFKRLIRYCDTWTGPAIDCKSGCEMDLSLQVEHHAY